MSNIFSSKFFAGNRLSLRQSLGADEVIAITANWPLQRSGDTTYKFRQDSSFWYLTGLNEPGLILVMTEGREFLILPKVHNVKEIFDGSVDTATISQNSGIDDVLNSTDGQAELTKLLKLEGSVSTLGSADPFVESYGFFVNPSRGHFIQQLKEFTPHIEIKDIRPVVAKLRSVKQPEEIQAIQTAINLTIGAFESVKNNLNSYSSETEVSSDINNFFNSHSVDHGYSPIIAGGLNACTLHYTANSARINSDELLLVDVGAEVSNYSADITRTLSTGKATKRHQEVFNSVMAVREYAMSLLKPGVLLKDYEKKVEARMREELIKLKLISKNTEEDVRMYYPHATSHFLGLDVHDVADYSRPLQPNMVLTVEPGIYIPEEKIGIRIEDDVLITEKSIRNLSNSLPTSLS